MKIVIFLSIFSFFIFHREEPNVKMAFPPPNMNSFCPSDSILGKLLQEYISSGKFLSEKEKQDLFMDSLPHEETYILPNLIPNEDVGAKYKLVYEWKDSKFEIIWLLTYSDSGLVKGSEMLYHAGSEEVICSHVSNKTIVQTFITDEDAPDTLTTWIYDIHEQGEIVARKR